MKTFPLNNGVEIPVLGLGTYRIGKSEDEVYNAIRTALDAGYRHIDTAAFYENERPIGKAIFQSGIAREEIFVTTKLWGTDVVKTNIPGAFETSLRNLGLDYVDLYLVHWPIKGKVASTWAEMEKIYSSGKTRAIGLSNHLIHHVEELLQTASVVPAVNQMELHPYLTQTNVVDFCKQKGIVPEAWSPLGSSKVPLLEDVTIKEIAEKYNKSVSQVILRWNIERGIVAIPKSSNAKRQKENLEIFDFELSTGDIAQINALDKNHRTGIHPDEIEF